MTLSRHRNPDGTWNGVTFFAEVTGLAEGEIKWSWERLKQLMCIEGKSKAEALAIVRIEAKSKPWLDTKRADDPAPP